MVLTDALKSLVIAKLLLHELKSQGWKGIEKFCQPPASYFLASTFNYLCRHVAGKSVAVYFLYTEDEILCGDYLRWSEGVHWLLKWLSMYQQKCVGHFTHKIRKFSSQWELRISSPSSAWIYKCTKPACAAGGNWETTGHNPVSPTWMFRDGWDALG